MKSPLAKEGKEADMKEYQEVSKGGAERRRERVKGRDGKRKEWKRG